MTTWLERNMPELGEWHLSSPENAVEEAEMSYLFNDIGPLIYVHGLAQTVEQTVLERVRLLRPLRDNNGSD